MGNRFKEAREKTGYSLDYVESQSGVSKNTIWKLEHDMVDAGYKLIARLADFYGVNVSWLIGQSDSPSIDESHQAVTNVTGLSEMAIQNLMRITNERGKRIALNHLLESEFFTTAIGFLSMTEIMIDKANPATENEPWIVSQAKEVSIDEDGNVSMKMSPKESARYLLQEASNAMHDVLTNIIINYWNQKVIEEAK